MAVSASAVNLADYALMSNEPMVQAMAWALINNGSVAQDMTLINKASLIANGVRFDGNLPTIDWTPLNSEGTTVHSQPTPFQENIYTMRNNVDMDKLIVEDVNAIGDPRAAQVEAVLRSLTYDFNDKFLNNEHVTGDKDAPIGIRYRLDNAASFGLTAANKVTGGAVDMTTSLTAATANSFFSFLDELLYRVDSPEGVGVSLYMNDVMYRRIQFAARATSGSGGFSTATDQLGRSTLRYQNATLRIIGVKADQSTQIIKGNGLTGSSAIGETTAGADSTGASALYTSIYAVNHSLDHLFGWQYGPPSAKDLGLLESGVIYRTFIDWAVGIMLASPRSVARLYDIKIA